MSEKDFELFYEQLELDPLTKIKGAATLIDMMVTCKDQGEFFFEKEAMEVLSDTLHYALRELSSEKVRQALEYAGV